MKFKSAVTITMLFSLVVIIMPGMITISYDISPVHASNGCTLIANAGSDQNVNSGDLVELDGSGSLFGPECTDNSYQWTQTSGPEVILSDSESESPTFIAPQIQEQVELTFQLVVSANDGTVNRESQPDFVTITVNPTADDPASPLPGDTVGSGNNLGFEGQKNTGKNILGQE